MICEEWSGSSRLGSRAEVGHEDGGDGKSRDPLFSAYKAHLLVGCGLDSNTRSRQGECCGKSLAHFCDVRPYLWSLGNERGIDIHDTPAGLLYETEYAFKQFDGTDALKCGICIWEMMADIAFSDCSEEGVCDRVNENVGIGMTIQTEMMRDVYTPEHQGTPLNEAVNVVADPAERNQGGCYVLAHSTERSTEPFHARTEILLGSSRRGVDSYLPPAASTRRRPAATSQRLTDCSM